MGKNKMQDTGSFTPVSKNHTITRGTKTTMNRNSKKISLKLRAVLMSALIFASSTAVSFADVRSAELDYLKQLSEKFKQNIDSVTMLDTNAGSGWGMAVDSASVKEQDDAMEFLQGVYSVVPFFNSMTIRSSRGNYEIDLKNLSQYESSKVVEIAQIWISEIVTEDMTDAEKLKAIHDKIINETTYDDSGGDESHSPAGVAMENKAVCDGYARMMSIMATLVDVPVIQVTSGTMDHAFNLVFTDGKWLLVDTTYDDPISNGKEVLRHDYFLIEPTASKKHKYDKAGEGLTLDDYIKIGNYVYQDVIS
ncbi:MAG: transglutaminase domain-containing protein [Proteocatella sp.]